MPRKDGSTPEISYHDTWISLDPIQGCAYRCEYCILRYTGSVGVKPHTCIQPQELIAELLDYPLFQNNQVPLALANETDIFHPTNRDYLVDLLGKMQEARIRNPICLITKAPLNKSILKIVHSFDKLRIIFLLSYSGLGKRFEPTFSDSGFRRNFELVKEHGFPLIHYWRPLMPDNTGRDKIREMLSFVSPLADASVFVGLKVQPKLSQILVSGGIVTIPPHLMDTYGEWLDQEVIDRILAEADDICPDYPLYRHTACALAVVLNRPNHTATAFRPDICLSSHCPVSQRMICENAKVIPSAAQIRAALASIGKTFQFTRLSNRVRVDGVVSQQEYAYLLHTLKCPLVLEAVKFDSVYKGSIYDGQKEF
jgi:DNA repair photolyase